MAHDSPADLRRIARAHAPAWALRMDFDGYQDDPGIDVVFAYRTVTDNAVVEQWAEIGPGGVVLKDDPVFHLRKADDLSMETARAVAQDLAALIKAVDDAAT